MRLRFAGLVFFILFFLLAAMIQWPAATLTPWLERASNGHWRLAAAEGSLWHGQATLLTRSSDAAPWEIAQNLHWKIRWSTLWRGRIAADIHIGPGAALLAVSPGGVSLEQFDVTLPATAAVALLPGALGRYGWAGNLRARGNSFVCAWGKRSCNGEIELLWSGAAVTEVPGRTLGDYRFRLAGEGQALHVDLTTLSGRLQISGSGEITGNGLSFHGEAGTSGSDAAPLDALLRTLGRPAATPGKYQIDYRESNTPR
ncbi:MAG: type II secretion system protein N [Betaproteobacteria bacterium]|nr:type II secretion system protein N [Betaproteobacteria bacterium]